MNQHRSCRAKILSVVFSLLIFAGLAFGQEGVPLFTKDFTPEEFGQRRSAVYDAIGANALAVVQGAPSPVGYVRFRQSNEFYYLCGIEVPHAYLLLDGAQRRASLYLPHRNEGRERSEGKMLSAEDAELVKQLSGIEAVYATEILGEHLARYARTAGNAWYPHYNAGKRQMQDGDLLLMDFAPDVGYYMSDVTRMWPVNGKFNAWQRELYDFYLGCYQAILKAIRPGVTAATIKQEASKAMEDILRQAKFSKPHYEKAAREFVESYRSSAGNPETYMGHWVGMATHDVGTHTGPLQPGMVFTIEPALRVPEEKIYIRLEDVIVITATGKEILSEFVPMDRAGIEKIMTGKGILETYAPAQLTSK